MESSSPAKAEPSVSPSSAASAQDRRWRRRIVITGVCILVPGLFWGIPSSKAVIGGIRVLEGDVPYRDFWTMYAPGQFYAVALLFAAFGRHMIVQGAAVIAIRAFTGGTLFTLLRRMGCERRAAVVVSVGSIAAFWTTAPELTSYPPALLLIVLAFDRLVRFLHGGNRRTVFVCGLLLGLAAVFKHDVAFYAAIGMATGVALGYRRGAKDAGNHPGPLAVIMIMAIGSILVVAPVAALLAWKAGADAYVHLFVFPSTDFLLVRTEGYPPLVPNAGPTMVWLRSPSDVYAARAALDSLRRWILCNVPQAILAAAVVTCAFRARRWSVAHRTVVVAIVACLALYWAASHVQDNTHVYSMAIFSFSLGALVWSRRSGRRSLVRPVLLCVGSVYALGLAVPPAMAIGQAAMHWRDRRMIDFPETWGIWVSGADWESYQPIASFIRAHVDPAERIYVGLKRHDAVVINDLRSLLLADRRSCTRFHELHPGVADRPSVQEEIVRDIERYDVRCIVLWEFGWSNEVLDRIRDRHAAAIAGAGATILDEYIARTFEPIARHGEYVLMWRKSERPTEPRMNGGSGSRNTKGVRIPVAPTQARHGRRTFSDSMSLADRSLTGV